MIGLQVVVLLALLATLGAYRVRLSFVEAQMQGLITERNALADRLQETRGRLENIETGFIIPAGTRRAIR